MKLIGSNALLVIEEPGDGVRDAATGQVTPTWDVIDDEVEAAVTMLDFRTATLGREEFTTHSVVAHIADRRMRVRRGCRVTVPADPALGDLPGTYIVTVARDTGMFLRVIMEATT